MSLVCNWLVWERRSIIHRMQKYLKNKKSFINDLGKNKIKI